VTLPRPLPIAAPLVFGIPTLLCLVLSVGWWKIGAVVPLVLLAGALGGCPHLGAARRPEAASRPDVPAARRSPLRELSAAQVR